MKTISEKLKNHYQKTFADHGQTGRGVDWGEKTWAIELRHRKMLEVLADDRHNHVSILDVGCGYGALAQLLEKEYPKITYTGIDLVPEMIAAARINHPEQQFINGDVIDLEDLNFDYVICNGVLTQKLQTSTLEMNHYCNLMFKKFLKK